MKYVQLIIWPVLCLAVGGLAARLQADSLQSWYPYLVKPALTPPDWAFPVAWTTLYILMGISIGMARMRHIPGSAGLTLLFLAQLAVNFAWSVVFFFFQSPLGGLAVISLLMVLLAVYIERSWKADRVVSGLFVPYIVWVCFAWYLNFFIFLYN